MQLLKRKAKVSFAGLLYLGMAITCGCTNDKDIKAQIKGLAKTDVNFAGVEYAVEGKTVTLTGKCPSKKAKEEVEQTIKAIKVVKGINNQIEVAPVTLDMGFEMKLAVDSVLAGYPTVTADVSESNVTLKGKVKKKELVPLLTGIKKLNLPNVDNQLSVD
jgi:hyperosmotically inducible protein